MDRPPGNSSILRGTVSEDGTLAAEQAAVAAEDDPMATEQAAEDAVAEESDPVAVEKFVSEDTDSVLDLTKEFADVPGAPTCTFTDHFSLQNPSSTVRFRSSRLRVYPQTTSQFVVEERQLVDDDDKQQLKIVVKRSTDTNFGHIALRGWYTLVSVFYVGFLFIYCFQIVLVLFLQLGVEGGATTTQRANWFAFVSTLLSLPVFVHGFSNAMAIGISFVADTWRGHKLLYSLGRSSTPGRNIIASEWALFTIYLGVPLLTLICALFARSDRWWEVTALTWYLCIFAFWCVYALIVTYIEASSSARLIEVAYCPENDEQSTRGSRWKEVLRKAIMVRQVQRYSGLLRKAYLVDSIDGDHASSPSRTDPQTTTEMKYITSKERRGVYSRLTNLACCGSARLYTKLDPPERVYSLEEILGISRIVTVNSWSLEKVYCRNNASARSIVIVNGESAVLPNQARSSVACAILGNLFAMLLLISLLVWFGAGGLVAGMVALLIIVCCIPSGLRIRNTFKAYNKLHQGQEALQEQQQLEEDIEESGDNEQQIKDDNNNGERGSDAIYYVRETWRETRPSDALCWAMFVLEAICFFIWPLVVLFTENNWPSAILFIIVGVFSFVRFYMDAGVILEELGSIDALGDSRKDGSEAYKWLAKSRLKQVLTNITRSKSRQVFAFIFSAFMVVLIFVSIGAMQLETNESTGDMPLFNTTLISNFYYPPQPNLPYPSCKIQKGLEVQGGFNLADFAFLSAVTYYQQRQEMLDAYFGKGRVIDDYDTVADFKATLEKPTAPFFFFTSTNPEEEKAGLIAVRGTQSNWDLLADAQLWSAAALAQGVRGLLPFGGIWTVVLDELVWLVTATQTQQLLRVSYYREVSAFIQSLRQTRQYTHLLLTGHSLGGGIALISGSQSEVPAVGISAPNSLLSRLSFKPPLRVDQLNEYTFNVIPDRDIVPMIDDVAALSQRVHCTAPLNHPLACHDVWRTWCDIQYTCGNPGRPTSCECMQKFGYPPPDLLVPVPTGGKRVEPNVTRSFEAFEKACRVSAQK